MHIKCLSQKDIVNFQERRVSMEYVVIENDCEEMDVASARGPHLDGEGTGWPTPQICLPPHSFSCTGINEPSLCIRRVRTCC